MTKRAIEAILSTPWAIADGWLETIASIAERESEYSGNVEALQAKLGRELGNTMKATVRDGVAIIPFEGPMFRRANLMTEFSGATSYDTLATDFAKAMEDPQVKAIIGYFDTPGGAVTGASELSAMVKAARGKKPLVAFVHGEMASAGLWIGSAFDRIIAADTAIVGSVGAQMGFTVSKPREGQKAYRFVSSQSPLKNADPETEAGAANAQKVVDDLAQVFIDTLATNRGTTSEKIVESYGKGAVFVANDALQRGMIDGIDTFENVLSTLSKEVKKMDYKGLTVAALKENRADLVQAISAEAVAGVKVPDVEAIRVEAATAERQRITDIMAAADGIAGADAIVTAAIADPKKSGSAVALDLLKHVKAQAAASPAPQPVPAGNAAHLKALKAPEADGKMPAPSASNDDAGTSDIDKGKAAVEALRKQGLIL